MRTPLAILLLAGTLSTQVPYGHFLVSARNAAAAGTGAYFFDAGTGDVTPVLGLNTTSPVLTGIGCVAIEPGTGDMVLTGGVAVSLVPVFYRLSLSGRLAGQLRRIQVSGFAGAVPDLTFDPNGQILFCGAGTAAAAGLWRVAPAGGPATQLGQVANAVEVISTPQAAYVLTRAVGQPSGIWRYDYGTAIWGQVVSGLPEATAFDNYATPLLLVGAQSGQLLLADPGSGAVIPFGNITGVITALRVSPQTGASVVLTTSGQVYNHSGALLGSMVSTVTDVDVGQLDQGSFFTFGSGCAGSNSQVPAIGASSPPAIPNPGFAITLANAVAFAPAVHVLGHSRRDWAGIPLPLDVGAQGAPGCFILCNPLLIGFAVAGSGGQASTPVPIPNDLSLRSARVMNQWWVVDPTANALGIVFSDGGEAVLR